MSKKKSRATIFGNPVYQSVVFEPFREAPKVPKKMPSDDEVIARFEDMVSDLEVRPERRIWFNQRPIAQKWELYCDHIREDADTPSPDYLLKCLNLRPGGEIFACIAKFISKGRISWVRRFIDLKGHQYLLSILSQNSKSFIPECFDDISREEVISGTLYCLKNIVNTKLGSKAIVLYPDVIPLVISSMNPKIPQTFEYALNILIQFLFGDNPSINNLSNIKLAFSSIHKLRGGWACFTNELRSRPDRQFVGALSTFVRNLLEFLSERHQMRLNLSMSIVDSGLLNALEELKYESSDPAIETISFVTSRVSEDMRFLSTISTEPIANPFSAKSLSKAIKRSIEPPMYYYSVLISLLSISSRYKNVSPKLFIFLHNFLIIFRYYLAHQDCSKMKYSISFASNLKAAINIPFSSNTFQSKPTYEELHSVASFVSDSELESLHLAECIDKGASIVDAGASDFEDSKVITSIHTYQDNEELLGQCEEKVQSLQDQLAAMKATVRMALESKEKEAVKCEELKAALDKIKKENESITKNAHEEVDAAKKEAELMRKEKDSAKAEAEASKSEIESLKRELAALKLKSKVKEKKSENESESLAAKFKKAESMIEDSQTIR